MSSLPCGLRTGSPPFPPLRLIRISCGFSRSLFNSRFVKDFVSSFFFKSTSRSARSFVRSSSETCVAFSRPARRDVSAYSLALSDVSVLHIRADEPLTERIERVADEGAIRRAVLALQFGHRDDFVHDAGQLKAGCRDGENWHLDGDLLSGRTNVHSFGFQSFDPHFGIYP